MLAVIGKLNQIFTLSPVDVILVYAAEKFLALHLAAGASVGDEAEAGK